MLECCLQISLAIVEVIQQKKYTEREANSEFTNDRDEEMKTLVNFPIVQTLHIDTHTYKETTRAHSSYTWKL